MVNATFNKAYLNRLLGFKIEEKKLFDQIAKMGPDVESVSEEEITIDLPANRIDLIDIVGFARAIRHFMHKSKKFRYEIKEAAPALEITVGAGVKEVRPFISGMVVRNMKFDEQSLRHLLNFTEKFASNYGRNRKKLAIGLHNLDAMGTKLDYDAVKNERFTALNLNKNLLLSEVLKEHEKGIAYAGTIGSSGMYPVLKDEKGIISFIPIINSERTRVTTSTKDLFIEITGTERFSVEKSMDLFAAIFMDMGGDVQKVKVSYGKSSVVLPKMSSEAIEIPLLGVESQIGVVIGFNNVISLANKMGYEAGLLGKKILFNVPVYRVDVINDQDVIEDVAIAYGYDYIQPVQIPSSQMGELEQATVVNKRITEMMVGMGFSEAMNSYLTNDSANFEKMRRERAEKEAVRIKNAKTQQISMMRTWLLPSLLKNLGMSQHESMPQRLFELDMSFRINNKVEERYSLCAVITDPKANFNQIKAVVEGVLDNLGISYKFKELPHRSFIDGRNASIVVDGATVGAFGELHPEVLSNFGIEEPTVAFEILL
ncbi:MAG: phenylalanine--tRNA ligase subunit beta [Candidatus Micrarchaeota archaeon]|nr:phenylalanine--tRNA ligase subunit beta [Candidatus Micrarchaeota archaeon]MDE1846975.1 phenylalanine--tRNA ligase subunit beta [Candidatus Micrarchaeota archaeon]